MVDQLMSIAHMVADAMRAYSLSDLEIRASLDSDYGFTVECVDEQGNLYDFYGAKDVHAD